MKLVTGFKTGVIRGKYVEREQSEKSKGFHTHRLSQEGFFDKECAVGQPREMQLRFRVPERQTRIRFLPSIKSLRSALAKRRGAVFLQDDGLPLETDFTRVSGGERAKSWDRLGALLGELAHAHIERSAPLVVIGGGAVCDFGAMAASIYRRGLPLVLVPSTLLAMVDAALGGKTAIDHGRLKNFAGTFYPADEVWVCPELLRTLPVRERVSGVGELWKLLWIAGGKKSDAGPLDFVLHGKISPALVALIKVAIAAKCKIVEQDPLDSLRIREILNFGHTAGHALEAAADGALSHGEAVLWGMAAETELLGRKGARMQKEIRRVLLELGLRLPKAFRETDEGAWLGWIRGDKKMKGGELHMTLLAAPGRPVQLKCAPERLARLLTAFPESYRP